jgi:hypothetical protein
MALNRVNLTARSIPRFHLRLGTAFDTLLGRGHAMLEPAG